MSGTPPELSKKEAELTGASVSTKWRDNLLRRVRAAIREWNEGSPCMAQAEVRELAHWVTMDVLAWLEPRMQELRQATLEWFFADSPDPVPGVGPAAAPPPSDRPQRRRARKRL